MYPGPPGADSDHERAGDRPRRTPAGGPADMSGTERARRRPAPALSGTPGHDVAASPVHERLPMLQVGAVDDAAEREADRLAEQAVTRLRALDQAPDADPRT